MSLRQDPEWQEQYGQLQDELEAVASSATVDPAQGPVDPYGPYRRRVLFIASQEPAHIDVLLDETRTVAANLNQAWGQFALDQDGLIRSIQAILEEAEAALAHFTTLVPTSRSGKYAEKMLDGELRAMKETYRFVDTNVKKPRERVKAFCQEVKDAAGSRRWYPHNDLRHIPEDAAALASLVALVKRMTTVRAKYDAETPPPRKRSAAEDRRMVKDLDTCISESKDGILGKIAAATEAYRQKSSHADEAAARRKSKTKEEPPKKKRKSKASAALLDGTNEHHGYAESAYMGHQYAHDPDEGAQYYNGHEYGQYTLGSSLLTPRKREIYRRVALRRL